MVVRSSVAGSFICWYCNESLKDKRQLEVHIKIEHGQLVYGQSEWYSCKMCYNALYCRRQDIIKHMRSAHQCVGIQPEEYLIKDMEQINLPCAVCGLKNIFSKYCKHHSTVTKEEKSISCSYCEERYSDFNILKAHVNIEHGKEVHGDSEFACFQCNQCCSELYLGSQSFLRHMLEVHNDTAIDNLDMYVVNYLSDIITTCKLCESPCLFSMFCCEHDARISTRYCEAHRHHNCLLCEASFVNCETLWRHKFSVHWNENLACNLCDDTEKVVLQSPRALMKHWLHRHWTVQQADEELESSSKVVNGVVHFICPYCNNKLLDFPTFRRHVHEVHLTASTCSLCGLTFKKVRHLREHLVSSHSDTFAAEKKPQVDTDSLNEGTTLINIEVNSISRMANLDKDVYKCVEGDQVKYKCSDCEKVYARFYELKRHLLVHRGQRNMSCTMCHKSYFNVSRLTEHYKRSHHMKVTKINELKKQAEICIDGTTKFKCPLCPSITSRYDSLQQHMKVHSGEKPFSCEVCGKRFVVREHLKRHFNNIHMKVGYQCNVCGRILTDSSNLKVHMRNHTGEKKYMCEVCGKGFSQWSSHYYHKFTHNKDRLFKCLHCGMTFRSPRTLNEHKKTHVVSDVKHACNTCGNEFNTRKNLLSHVKIHVSGRPHQCDVCSAKFKLKKYLIQHLRTHKGATKLDSSDNFCL